MALGLRRFRSIGEALLPVEAGILQSCAAAQATTSELVAAPLGLEQSSLHACSLTGESAAPVGLNGGATPLLGSAWLPGVPQAPGSPQLLLTAWPGWNWWRPFTAGATSGHPVAGCCTAEPSAATHTKADSAAAVASSRPLAAAAALGTSRVCAAAAAAVRHSTLASRQSPLAALPSPPAAARARPAPPGLRRHSRGLHGMVSVMTAAESARDVLSAIAHPVSYTELAAHLARDYSPELFDAVTGLVLCHAEELSGPELSNILWAYTTVGHHDEGLVGAVLLALAGKVSELGPADLANTVWALTRHEAYEPELVAALAERVWEALPTSSPRQLAALAQGFAYFRQQEPQLEEDEDLLKSISVRFREQVDSAGAPEVAMLLSAMARLRRYDPALLADACRVLAAAAPSAPLCALAEATWALALLQHVDEPLLEAVVDRVAEAARVASGLAPAPQSVATSVSSSLPLPLPLRAGTAAAAAATMAAVAKNTQSSESVQLATALQKQANSLAKDQRRAGGSSGAARGAGAGGEGGSASASTGGSVSAAYASRKVRSREALAAARSGPTCFSAMWPTQVGPGGHHSPCAVTERFNPSLPFNWSAEAPAAGARGGAGTGSAGGAHGAAAAPGTAGAAASKPQQAPAGAAPAGTSAAAADKAAAEDAAALADPDTVSKFLWGFGALHCYSDPLYTLLFRVLPRLRHDRASWSALARLMGAHVKALELQPGVGLCRINPLEAESTTAWIRLQRSRTPMHRMPDHFLTSAFVAFQAEGLGRDHHWAHPAAQRQQEREQHVDRMQPQPPSVTLSRLELESEVATTLRAMGVELRPSATIDGMFTLPHTMLINGMTLSVEVLSAGCCALDPPHRALGPAVARLRSLEFRGWSPLVVPFHEWAALTAEEGPAALALTAEPDGAAKRAAALQAAAAARHRYLLRKLEEIVGEKINADELRRTQKMPRRRLA